MYYEKYYENFMKWMNEKVDEERDWVPGGGLLPLPGLLPLQVQPPLLQQTNYSRQGNLLCLPPPPPVSFSKLKKKVALSYKISKRDISWVQGG